MAVGFVLLVGCGFLFAASFAAWCATRAGTRLDRTAKYAMGLSALGVIVGALACFVGAASWLWQAAP